MVGLLVSSMRPGRCRRRNVARPGSEDFARRAMLFGSAVLVLICLLFTRSRGGIASALVGLALSAILLVRARAASEGSSRTRIATYLVVALVLVSLVLAVIIGVAPILERMEPDQLRLSAEGRYAIYAATFRAGMEFLPFGSGLGTYVDVFARFQGPTGQGALFDYARNDYLQMFMEAGIPGVVAVALLIVAYAKRLSDLLWREGRRSFTLLQLGAAVGLLPMMLHSVFDFAIRMPANAIWYATLAGVMFHRGVAVTEPFEGEKRKEAHQHPQSAPELVIP